MINVHTRFRRVLLLTVLTALGGYGVAEGVYALLIPALLAAGIGWWFTEHKAESGGWNGLPRWLTNLVLIFLVLWAAVTVWQGETAVTAFALFLGGLLVLKLWEKREVRDYGQILTMSLFLMIGGMLTSNSLALGIALAVQLPLLVASVILFQIHAAEHEAGVAGAVTVQRPWKQVRRPIIKVVAGTVLASILLAGAVFIVVPRGVGLRQWGEFGRTVGGRATGFSEEVTPGLGGITSTSQAEVFEVQMRDSTDRIVGGMGQPMYFRGAVLTNYNPQTFTWSKAARSEEDSTRIAAGLAQGQRVLIGRPAREPALLIDQWYTQRSGARGWVPMFALQRPVQFYFTTLARSTDIAYDPALGTISRRSEGESASFWVRSAREAPDTVATIRPEGVQMYPSLEVQRFAKQLLRDAAYDPDPATRPPSDDEPASRVFETYLRTRFRYQLDVGAAPPGRDPVEWFLFTKQAGHCEYFASALAALCRSVGIDARVVTGYASSEFDEETNNYTVRDAHAHAWVEVLSADGLWVQRDGTPIGSAQALQQLDQSMWTRVAGAFGMLDQLWNTHVVSFDRGSQERLISPELGTGSSEWIRNLSRRLQDLRHDRTSVGNAVSIALWAGAGVLALGIAWAATRAILRKRRQRRERIDDAWAMTGAPGAAYARLLQLLASRGFAKPKGLLPLLHLDDVARADAELAAQSRSIMLNIYRARFGAAAGKTALADTEAALARLAKASHAQAR